MYILLILFFVSFFGIMFMIGRKLSLVRNGHILGEGEALFEVPHFENIKHFTLSSAKKYGHVVLVETIRMYVKTTLFLKESYRELKIKFKKINTKKDENGNGVEKVEVSSFLKMISDYKQKIKKIKQKIHEEEKNQ